MSPKIVDYLDDWDVMVAEYIEGETLTDETVGTREQIPRIAGTLRRLHAGPRFRTDFDMFATTQRWLRVCAERELTIPDGLGERMGLVRRAAEALAARPIASVPCHNDLSADNFIDDGRKMWIIDFEYSGNNDPCYDIADVANQSDLDDDWRARLCEAYFGNVDSVLITRMTLYALVANVGWAVWASIQRQISALELDFARIATMFWDPAVALLDSEDFPRLLRSASRGAVAS